MGVFLGNIGGIEITRGTDGSPKESIVNPSDVNVARNRFSFDFDEGYLIAGDLVEFKTTDDTNLDFVVAAGWVNNTVQTSGNWYVFIDELGAIRLYDNFDDSLEGDSAGLVQLAAIVRDIPIRVTVRDRDSRLLASITEYELNTNRETVDITTLSDQYRQQYSSLITGSGSLTAEWDYVNDAGAEPVNYLMQLVLRTEIGSGFHAKFYIKSAGTSAAAGTFSGSQTDDALWWEFDAIVTGSATSFAPGAIITSRIDFVATGAIRLRARTSSPRRLLLQSGSSLLTQQYALELLEGDELP
jgi:hypothetical protein